MLRLFTDTDTDLTPEEASYYGYTMISMPYIIDGKEVKPYVDFKEFNYKEFYNLLRKGTMPSTCALNIDEYKKYFEPVFASGDDILYVHFSSAMTATFDFMNLALDELKELYPERRFYSVDTKGITILSLNIVKEIGDMYLSGKSADEIMEWANKEVDHFATYFYADNLKFFSRSGRISNVSAVMGNLIGIKPIIYMNEEGKMTNLSKERGRNSALRRLISYFDELAIDIDKHRVIIGHSDSLEIAEKLGQMLQEKYEGKLRIEYAVVNPTAGSHCGPDGVGISFYAKHK